MPAKYCYQTGRRVAPIECGTFDHCQPDCELRPHIKGSQPGPDHKCGMCKKSYPEVQFDPHRKTGKPKKTCTVCEAKYIKKTTPAAETKAPAPTKPAPPSEKKEAGWVPLSFDLSGFTKLINPTKDDGEPAVKITGSAVSFNLSARHEFQSVFDKCLSMDIHYKKQNGKLQIAFEPHPTERAGQYKVSRGTKGKEFKVAIQLYKKGGVEKGQALPVRQIGGILLAEK